MTECPCCGTQLVLVRDHDEESEGSDYDIDELLAEFRADAEAAPETVEEMKPYNDPALW